jgi:hypothetical protein
MFRRLLPHSPAFFDYFDEHVAIVVETCKQNLALMTPGADMASIIRNINRLENQADDVTHTCIEALHKTFITPIDRYDIHNLIKRMDDIVDTVDAMGARLSLYEIREIRPEAQALAEVLLQCSLELGDAVRGLRNLKNAKTITQKCIRVHHLEYEADALLRTALVRLFKEEKDTLLLIKWKEIYERLEKATDRCDDVADIIEGVVIEAS